MNDQFLSSKSSATSVPHPPLKKFTSSSNGTVVVHDTLYIPAPSLSEEKGAGVTLLKPDLPLSPCSNQTLYTFLLLVYARRTE